MKIWKKAKKLSEMTDDELHAQYKLIAERYDKKRTETDANKLNEIVIEWENRKRKENLPEEKKYHPILNVEVPEEPPLEVQKAIFELDPKAAITEIKTKIDEPKPQRQEETKKEQVLQEQPVKASETKTDNKPKDSEKPPMPKKSIFFAFKKNNTEHSYCIRCKHDSRHHVRKDGSSEGCKLCGCLMTLEDIKNQEEISKCAKCDEDLYVIEAKVYEESLYHLKCYEQLMWDMAKKRRQEREND